MHRFPLFLAFVSLLGLTSAAAQDYSTNSAGTLGLNTVPTARMAPVGTLWGGAAFSDPYLHGFMGLQIAEPLSITLRQSAEMSGFEQDPERLYPGLDFKLGLLEENRSRPHVALGVQSATGHTRMGGEYLAVSKRYKAFDFTAGLGWGRFGSAFHIDNPFKHISSHFDKRRALDGDAPVQPSDWFTGNHVGFFGGVEYFTPVKGLSFKLDAGADRYSAEKEAIAFSQPAPWSAGINYQMPLGNAATLDAGLAAQGTDRLMARLSISGLLERWKRAPRKTSALPFPQERHAQQSGAAHKVQLDALRDRMIVSQTREDAENREISATLSYDPTYNLPSQIGVAARHMAANAAPQTEKLTIRPAFLGLEGPEISLMRRDLEHASHDAQGSAAEIWQNAEIQTGIGVRPWWKKCNRFKDSNLGFMPFKLTLDHQFSLAEEDYIALQRTSVVAKMLLPRKTGYLDYGAALRVNISDNLRQLEGRRIPALIPVRSDVADYATSFLGLDEAYVAFTHSFKSDLHLSAMTGYLEEMYAGAGGELLYRPFASRFAVGAEGFSVFKRDTDTALNLGLNGNAVLTGQVNAYYDLPFEDITINAATGRFLGADSGARLGFMKGFDNGVRLEGFVTLSDTGDPDPFGGTTHADHGVRLTLPLGGFKYLPDYSSARVSARPFGRDIGQSLNKPLDLYAITTPFTLPHMTQHWGDVIER